MVEAGLKVRLAAVEALGSEHAHTRRRKGMIGIVNESEVIRDVIKTLPENVLESAPALIVVLTIQRTIETVLRLLGEEVVIRVVDDAAA